MLTLTYRHRNKLLTSSKTDVKFRKLVVLPKLQSEVQESEVGVPSSLDPSFIPLLHVSDAVQDIILSRVLWFAMDIDEYKEIFSLEKSEIKALRCNQATFPLISKIFYRLSLPYLYGYSIISSHHALELFADRILDNGTLGSYIRSLHFYDFCFWKHNERLRQIVSRAPHLIQLDSSLRSPCVALDILDEEYRAHLNWGGSETLANTAGSTLVVLRNLIFDDVPEAIQNPATLGQFTNLRVLTGEMTVEFTTDPGCIRVHASPKLELIELETCSSSFLDVLTKMHLTTLRKINLPNFKEPIAFLEEHGSKILELEIELDHVNNFISDLCQNTILTISIYDEAPYPGIFTAHPCVSKIIFSLLS